MSFKIETYGPTVVLISFNGQTCMLPIETIKKLKELETAGPFRDKLIAEVKPQKSGMADALMIHLADQKNLLKVMDYVRTFILHD